MKIWIKRLFCSHQFRLTDPDEYFPLPEEVGVDCISYIREHTCNKCGETRLIGSGFIY